MRDAVKKVMKKYAKYIGIIKKHLLPNLPYIFVGWLSNKASEAYGISDGNLVAHRLLNAMNNLSAVMANPLPSFHHIDLLVGIIGAAAFYGIVYVKKKTAKKWRHDIEYGSAVWGRPIDMAPYTDPDPDNNLILTATESLTMSSRPKLPKHARNKNVLVIGGSGSGKTRFFVKPNIMGRP